MWAILLANKVLAQYHEATGDARVLDAVVRSLRAMATGLDRTPLYDWGRFRWFEGLIPAFHAYEHTREPWLLDLARKLPGQSRPSRSKTSGCCPTAAPTSASPSAPASLHDGRGSDHEGRGGSPSRPPARLLRPRSGRRVAAA